MPVELIFIHGWGFDARFWDEVSALLPHFRQRRIDLGFFGAEHSVPREEGNILVGHSLGFIHGLNQKQDWSGWIAVNGFPRFVETPAKPGCVTAASLREMRMRLNADSGKVLQDFYKMIGAVPVSGAANGQRLREGLDELRESDVEDILAKLDIPGLVLAARNDPLVPLETSEALGHMAGCRNLELHEKGGHLLPQTAPDWCARHIDSFITAHFGDT